MKEYLKRFAGPAALLAALFWALPPLISSGSYTFGWLMVPLLLLMFPAVTFGLCTYDGWRYGFSWLLPLIGAALFLSTVFVYYNESALFYVVIYGSLGYIGELCGFVSYRNRIKAESSASPTSDGQHPGEP